MKRTLVLAALVGLGVAVVNAADWPQWQGPDRTRISKETGGPGAGMVKLDKMTGKTVWTSKDLSDTAAYSSIAAADIGGVRTYLTFTDSAGVGVRASDGKLMFRYAGAANRTANVATPIFCNNKVFFSSAYGAGGGLLDLSAQNGRGRLEGGVSHAEHAEPSRRDRARGRLPVRVQRHDLPLPGICHGQR